MRDCARKNNQKDCVAHAMHATSMYDRNPFDSAWTILLYKIYLYENMYIYIYIYMFSIPLV